MLMTPGFARVSSGGTWAVPKPRATARNGSVVTAVSSRASGTTVAFAGTEPGRDVPAGVGGAETGPVAVFVIWPDGTAPSTDFSNGNRSALTSLTSGCGLGGCQGGASTPGSSSRSQP